MSKLIDKYLVSGGVEPRDLLRLRSRGMVYGALGLMAVMSLGLVGLIAANILA